MNSVSETRSLNIGQAAKLSGVSAKMIRHYESLDLLPRVMRTESGYRKYGMSEVHTLQFIRRSRDLGFSIPEIAQLLDLWHNRRRASSAVKKVALRHVEELSARIEEMKAMKRTLEGLAASCHGDERPDCPILDDLAKGMVPAAGHCASGTAAAKRAVRTPARLARFQ